MGKREVISCVAVLLFLGLVVARDMDDDEEYEESLEDERFAQYYDNKIAAYAFAGLAATYIGRPYLRGYGSTGGGSSFSRRSSRGS